MTIKTVVKEIEKKDPASGYIPILNALEAVGKPQFDDKYQVDICAAKIENLIFHDRKVGILTQEESVELYDECLKDLLKFCAITHATDNGFRYSAAVKLTERGLQGCDSNDIEEFMQRIQGIIKIFDERGKYGDKTGLDQS